MFVLIYWFREFHLSAVINRFELRCQLKPLLLLYYKIWPCCFQIDVKNCFSTYDTFSVTLLQRNFCFIVCRIRKILEPADPSYCENATAIFDLLTQKLGIQRKSKAVTLLHEAFPNVQLGDIRGFQVLFGVKQKDNIENVDYPVFTEEDLTLSDDIVSTDDADMVTDSSTQRVLEEQSPFVVGVPTSSSTPGKQILYLLVMLLLSAGCPRKGFPFEESLKNSIFELVKEFLLVNDPNIF